MKWRYYAYSKRTKEITQEDFIEIIEKEYKKFSRTKIEDYLIYLHGNNIIAFIS